MILQKSKKVFSGLAIILALSSGTFVHQTKAETTSPGAFLLLGTICGGMMGGVFFANDNPSLTMTTIANITRQDLLNGLENKVDQKQFLDTNNSFILTMQDGGHTQVLSPRAGEYNKTLARYMAIGMIVGTISGTALGLYVDKYKI